jgi:Helix-turn-helix domain
MPEKNLAHDALHQSAKLALQRLGEDLALARKRRKESRAVWAERVGVSVPTLTRLERGDAGVGMGVLAQALWLIGRQNALAELAAPEHDRGALEAELRVADKRSVRKAHSVEERLQ